MKKSKITLVVVLAIIAMMTSLFAACEIETGHTCDFASATEWTLVTAPTETETGTAAKVCLCGEADTETVSVPALTDESVWTLIDTVASTCTVKGSKTYVADLYGDVTVAVELAPHTPDDPIEENRVDPTCTTNGSYDLVSYCSVCDGVASEETFVIDALGHDMQDVEGSAQAATCTEAGKEADKKCSRCDDTIIGSAIDALGHDHSVVLNDTAVAATCTEAGKEADKKCSRCDDTIIGSAIDALGHSPAEAVIENGSAATCTEKGSYDEVVYCSVCDDEISRVHKEVDALGHDIVNHEGQAPDYNNAGWAAYETCSRCEEHNTYQVLAKLVAPYDGKAYSNLNFDADSANGGFANNSINAVDSWNNAVLTFDANGVGTGTGWPADGQHTITMIDPSMGEISIEIIDDDETKIVKAFVDMESGLIVRPALRGENTSFTDVLLFTPFEAEALSSNAKASAWDGNLAIAYTFDGVTYNILITFDRVYFGVSFYDFEGNAIADASTLYSASYVSVKNSDGAVINNFVHNGEKLVEADGLEGTYSGANGNLVISGCGTATLDGAACTYVIADGAYSADFYYNGFYYELTLDGGAYTLNKVMVEISFDAGEYAEISSISVNKNIPYELPVPEVETHILVGWFYDAACLEPVESPFIPKDSGVFYAKWEEKAVLTIVVGDTTQTVYAPYGADFADYLPEYGVDGINVAEWKYFGNWSIIVDGEAIELEVEALIDGSCTVVANLIDLPVYYGDYLGTELYNAGYGNSARVELHIDRYGNISGQVTGNVTAYDAETQVVTFSGSAGKFYFNAEAGVIAGLYSNRNYIGSDYYFFTRVNTRIGAAESDFKAITSFGVKAPKEPGSSTTGHYAQFVKANTDLGETVIFMYNNRIYANPSITNVAGDVLDITAIKNSQTVVVKDSSGNLIIGLKAVNASFGTSSNTVVLDSYYGTYTNGDDSLILDGAGGVIYGDKEGTYVAAPEGSAYTFDVYLNDGAEYYQLTVDGSSFSIVKPMVSVSFVVMAGVTPIESMSVNKNVVLSLQDHICDGFVFNGYFFDADYSSAVSEDFIPTEDVVIYVKHSLPAVLTIVYNDGATENSVITYSVGDVAEIEKPVYAKHKFVGWFTDASFAEGSEWTSGSVINVDTTIYAKWEDAPVYNNNYLPTYVMGTNANGSTSSLYSYASGLVAIDPDGNAPNSNYPFNSGVMTVKNYDKATGYLELHAGTSKVYKGYIESTSGIIILTYGSSSSADFSEVWILSPFETKSFTSKISSSYWNSGKSRAIEYTYDGTVYRIFVHNDNVYFGVSFVDNDGNAIIGKNCYNNSSVKVYASDNSLIEEFGYNGTALVLLDGLQGTYTLTDGADLVINGCSGWTIGDLSGTYTAQDGKLICYTADNSAYYEIVLGDDGTYTIDQPMAHVSFSSEYGDIVEEVNYNINVEHVLPVIDDTDTHIFRGWIDADGNVITAITPVANVSLTANWIEKVTLTIVYGNGLDNASHVFGAGDNFNLSDYEPAFKDGMAFDYWSLISNDEGSAEMDNITSIDSSTTIYAVWQPAHAMFGEYTGFEIYGATSCSGSKTLKVDALGKTSGHRSSTITDYDPATGMFKIGNYVGAYDAVHGILAYNYYGSGSNLKDDLLIFAKGTFTADKENCAQWNNKLTRLITTTLDGETKLLFVYNDRLYFDVSYTSTQGNITVKNIESANDVNIYDSNGALIAMFVKVDGAFVGLDGYQGTYSGSIGSIVLDGAGAVSGDVEGSYEIADGKFVITSATRMYVVTVENGAYTVVQDGYQGTYTVSGSDVTIILDGYGLTADGATYIVSGGTLTVYSGDTSTGYGITLGSFELASKSIFAGLTFTGTYYSEWDGGTTALRVIFDDSSNISGVIYSGYNTSYYFYFTATYENGVLSMTLTKAINGAVGKVLTANVSGNSIRFVNGADSNSQIYNFGNQGVVTCADFNA